jgi:hypothetical protein
MTSIKEHVAKQFIEDSYNKEQEIVALIAKNQSTIASKLHGYVPNELIEHLLNQTKEFYSFQLDNEGRMRVLLKTRYLP